VAPRKRNLQKRTSALDDKVQAWLRGEPTHVFFRLGKTPRSLKRYGAITATTSLMNTLTSSPGLVRTTGGPTTRRARRSARTRDASMTASCEGDAIDPEDPPTYESQASYLERHGLFLPGEKKRLTKYDWLPDALIAG
jgi:hypothetical protein